MMRSLIIAATLAAVSAAPALAVPFVIDGNPAVGLGAIRPAKGLSRTEIDALGAHFAQTGIYGDVLAADAALRISLPGLALPRQLLAAAQAAAGRAGDAAATLAGARPEAGTADRDDSWGWVASALIERQRGALTEAARDAATALRASPANAYAHNVAGTIAVLSEAYEEAIGHFTKAVENAPEAPTYLANLGAVLVETRSFALADAALTGALRRAPTDCTALVAAGRLLSAFGQLSAAVGAFERCLAAQPGQPLAATLLVETLIAMADFDGAADVVARNGAAFADPALTGAVIALHAGDGRVALDRLAAVGDGAAAALPGALAAALAGDPGAGAVRAADAARAGSASAWTVHAGLAAAAGVRPDPAMPADTPGAVLFGALAGPAAEEALAAALATPDIPRGMRFDGATAGDMAVLAAGPVREAMLLGMVLDGQRLSHAAAGRFARAAEIAPGAALVQAMLGNALAATDPTAAAAAFEAALAASPELWIANRRLGEILSRQGRFGEAARRLQVAASTVPDEETLLLLALAAQSDGDTPMALASYERLAEAAPDSAFALNQFAWFLATETQDLDRAVTLATRADALRPGNAAILDTLGWARYRRGDIAAGLDALRAAFAASGETRLDIGLRLARVAVAAGDRADAKAVLERLDALAGGRAAGAEVDAVRALVEG